MEKNSIPKKTRINSAGDLKRYALARLKKENLTRAHYAAAIETSNSTLTRFLNSKKEGEAAILFETALKLILVLGGTVEMPGLDGEVDQDGGDSERIMRERDLELKFLRKLTSSQSRMLRYLTGKAGGPVAVDDEDDEADSARENKSSESMEDIKAYMRRQELELNYLREAADNQTRILKYLTRDARA